MKRFFGPRRARIRAERQSVRLEIREEILAQRALRIEIETTLKLEAEEMARLQVKTALLMLDAAALVGKKVYSANSPDCQTCPHRLACKDACLLDLYPQGTIETNPTWKAQYDAEYWDWVDSMEEAFEREWGDDRERAENQPESDPVLPVLM